MNPNINLFTLYRDLKKHVQKCIFKNTEVIV